MAAHDPLRWEKYLYRSRRKYWQVFLTHSSGFLWGVEESEERIPLKSGNTAAFGLPEHSSS